MLGAILFALFLTAAAASLAVLIDGFLRGREAFARLRRDLGREAPAGAVRVAIEGPAACSTDIRGLCESRPRPVSRPAGDRLPRPVRGVACARHSLAAAA